MGHGLWLMGYGVWDPWLDSAVPAVVRVLMDTPPAWPTPPGPTHRLGPGDDDGVKAMARS